jgi:hypothetical protein
LSVELPERWQRVEGLHFGPSVAWLELAVDEAGNLLATRELLTTALPSLAAPAVLAARSAPQTHRNGREVPRYAHAGPLVLLGPTSRQWGAPATVRDEFAQLGVELLEGNEDRAAGLVRIRELLRLDPKHPFPLWHPRAGESGAPRLYLKGCPRLLEQLSSAPIDADDEPLPGAAVSERWEQRSGGLIAALRYAVLSRPSPTEPVERTEWKTPRARMADSFWKNELEQRTFD